jgi:hypothetical protein
MKKQVYILCLLSSLYPQKFMAGEFSLPTLTAEEQAAGVSGSKFYAPELREKGLYSVLHDKGNTTHQDFLTDFFFKSLFQNYIERFLGYDLSYNYAMITNPENKTIRPYDIRKFNRLYTFIDPRISITLERPENALKEVKANETQLTTVQKAIDMLKHNDILRELGTAYQRNKIVVEKIQDSVRSNPQLQKELYIYDRITTDLQTMIFNFMKEATSEFLSNYRAAATPAQRENACDFLETFRPSWLEKPYYKTLLKNIQLLMFPREVPGSLTLDDSIKDAVQLKYPALFR